MVDFLIGYEFLTLSLQRDYLGARDMHAVYERLIRSLFDHE